MGEVGHMDEFRRSIPLHSTHSLTIWVIELNVMKEMFYISRVIKMVVISYIWLSSIWNVASVAGELNFKFFKFLSSQYQLPYGTAQLHACVCSRYFTLCNMFVVAYKCLYFLIRLNLSFTTVTMKNSFCMYWAARTRLELLSTILTSQCFSSLTDSTCR